MSSNHKRNSNNKCYPIIFINCIIKIVKNIFKIMFKVTLFHLLWMSIVTMVVIIFWNLNLPSKHELKISYENPVILWWTSGFPGTAETRHCGNSIKCDVFSNKDLNEQISNINSYLFYGSSINFDDLPLPRRPDSIIWGLFHEESPRNAAELMHEKILNLFNFSSTLSRHSDVPFPLQYLDSLQSITSWQHFVETSVKNILLNEIAPILYIQSDCETSTERDSYVNELMKHIKVDSYGLCLNNKVLPAELKDDYLNNLNENNFLNFVARYKFVIAIENGVCEDYITEKLWRAIKVGSVPIYFGSPTIKDWLPNKKSAILIEDFATPEILSKYLKKLLKDDKLYEEHLEHKIEHKITNKRLVKEINLRPYQIDTLETVKEFECFVCKKLHEKILGKLVHVVNKRHYNCPIPVSALSRSVNPSNDWVRFWESSKDKVDLILENIS